MFYPLQCLATLQPYFIWQVTIHRAYHTRDNMSIVAGMACNRSTSLVNNFTSTMRGAYKDLFSRGRAGSRMLLNLVETVTRAGQAHAPTGVHERRQIW